MQKRHTRHSGSSRTWSLLRSDEDNGLATAVRSLFFLKFKCIESFLREAAIASQSVVLSKALNYILSFVFVQITLNRRMCMPCEEQINIRNTENIKRPSTFDVFEMPQSQSLALRMLNVPEHVSMGYQQATGSSTQPRIPSMKRTEQELAGVKNS